jgi:alcohol dehydrogenase class IV
LTAGFTWRDAGRTVVFGRIAERNEGGTGGVAAAVGLLRERGISEFALLSTERALRDVGGDGLAEAACRVHLVAPGPVPAASAALTDALAPPPQAGEGVQVRPLVALGGGRVIDVAKAIASISGADVVAIPTTLSGAPMTGIHRLPAGAEERAKGLVRPSLVIADPEAMTGQPERAMRASAINALAHGADTLYLPLSNPVSEMTALRGAALIAGALDEVREERDRAALALGAILCGYAIDSAGIGLHHLVCQTLVRICGTPHAETNAAILPQALAYLAERAPEPFEQLADALATPPSTGLKGAHIERNRPVDLVERVKELGRPRPLGELGGDEQRLDEAIEAMLQRPELASVPGPPSAENLKRLVRTAW